ncbi:MAG TPA: tyrosine--tRNA ligase [Dehalococcoidales bacterium]|nr:tyrosine--tRNA ligase [Dehalococcoidales bacterium]
MTNVKTNLTDAELRYLLKRGVSEIISEQELIQLLKSGKQLRLKEGFDPSTPDIHLGHVVGLRKLRQFQDIGHQVVLIVGDWTAQIGDPSGTSVTRPMLTAKQVKANAETYMRQFFKIVDREKTEVRWQSEWFGKFTLADVIRLASKFTVAQMLQREDFNNRFNAGKPLAVTELLYPMLQGYDSVVVKADVEFGGQDQKFNFLVGRELQQMVGQKPQQCFMTGLLVGTDGVHKMSKSLGNYIAVDDAPDQVYGKVMSIADNMIGQYFDLLTDISETELQQINKQLSGGTTNPMEFKKRLARELVTMLHGQSAAAAADENFTRVFQKREMPEEVEEIKIAAGEDLKEVLVRAGAAKSKSDAGRLIQQGAVSIDGEKIETANVTYKNGNIIKIGKHRFLKVVLG